MGAKGAVMAARLQVLPLPTTDGVTDVPFVLVVDQAVDLEMKDFRADVECLRASTGARGVLVFDKRVDV
jgi:hypothetical protein